MKGGGRERRGRKGKEREEGKAEREEVTSINRSEDRKISCLSHREYLVCEEV